MESIRIAALPRVALERSSGLATYTALKQRIAKPPTTTMDYDQVTDGVEIGIAGGSFLARYTPPAHLVGSGANERERDHSTWVPANRRQISALPTGGHRHALIQDDARGLLNATGDDWAVISLFAIATHTTTPKPTLVIVLRPTGNGAARAAEILSLVRNRMELSVLILQFLLSFSPVANMP